MNNEAVEPYRQVNRRSNARFVPFFCRQLREYFTGPQKMHFSKRYPTRLEKCIFVGKSALFLVHFSPSDNAVFIRKHRKFKLFVN